MYLWPSYQNASYVTFVLFHPMSSCRLLQKVLSNSLAVDFAIRLPQKLVCTCRFVIVCLSSALFTQCFINPVLCLMSHDSKECTTVPRLPNYELVPSQVNWAETTYLTNGMTNMSKETCPFPLFFGREHKRNVYIKSNRKNNLHKASVVHKMPVATKECSTATQAY